MQQFLATLHESVPILPKERFLDGIRNSVYSYDLVKALALITAKIIGFKFQSRELDLDSRIDLMMRSGLQEQESKEAPTIDQFRKDCLLTFYEFHQSLENQAWLRLGGLVRLARWKGLDRLDEAKPDQTRISAWRGASEADLEDWRLVWWFIYRLDTYVNSSLGKPYLIDEKMVKASLPGPDMVLYLITDPEEYKSPQGTVKLRLYLPGDTVDHWSLVPEIASWGPPTRMIPNLDILFSTATRQFGRGLRQLYTMSMYEFKRIPPISRLNDASTFLGTLNYSIESHNEYSDPTPRPSLDKSLSDYRGRLVTLLQYHMCNLQLALMGCSNPRDDNIQDKWPQQWWLVGDACQKIASVARNMNKVFSLAVDPRIAPIIFTTLIFVRLRLEFSDITPGSDLYDTPMDECEPHLLYLLKRLGNTWPLPRLLAGEYKKSDTCHNQRY